MPTCNWGHTSASPPAQVGRSRPGLNLDMSEMLKRSVGEQHIIASIDHPVVSGNCKDWNNENASASSRRFGLLTSNTVVQTADLPIVHCMVAREVRSQQVLRIISGRVCMNCDPHRLTRLLASLFVAYYARQQSLGVSSNLAGSCQVNTLDLYRSSFDC